MIFHYTAKEKTSRQAVRGTIEAKDETEAAKQLRNKKMVILSLSSTPSHGLHLSLRRISTEEKILFTKELAVMIKAGLPIVKALHSIHDQTTNRLMQKTITALINKIEGGSSLSAAFATYPKVFSPLFVSAVATGEKSGRLETVLDNLADQLEKDHELSQKIRGALIYPIFVLIVLLVVMVIVLIYVIPQFKTIFEDVGTQLPLVTTLLLTISDLVRKYILLWIGLVVGGYLLIRFLKRFSEVNYFLEQVGFKVPVFGSLRRAVLMVRFTNTLATLVKAGLPIIEAIKITGQAMNSPTFTRAVNKIVKKVTSGSSLSAALLEDRHFPVMIGEMVGVGEGTGKTDETLFTLSEFFGRQVNNTTRNLSSLLEPVIMLVIGIGIAFVVASVIGPIYGLVNAI